MLQRAPVAPALGFGREDSRAPHQTPNLGPLGRKANPTLLLAKYRLDCCIFFNINKSSLLPDTCAASHWVPPSLSPVTVSLVHAALRAAKLQGTAHPFKASRQSSAKHLWRSLVASFPFVSGSLLHHQRHFASTRGFVFLLLISRSLFATRLPRFGARGRGLRLRLEVAICGNLIWTERSPLRKNNNQKERKAPRRPGGNYGSCSAVSSISSYRPLSQDSGPIRIVSI